MTKNEYANLAKRIGMTRIYGTLNGNLIGIVPGFSGLSVCNINRGVAASGFPNITTAINWIKRNTK